MKNEIEIRDKIDSLRKELKIVAMLGNDPYKHVKLSSQIQILEWVLNGSA